MLILKGDRFKLGDGRTYTLLGQSENGNLAFVIDISEHDALPRKIDGHWLRSSAQLIEPTSHQPLASSRISQFSSKSSINLCNRVWVQIEPLTRDFGALDPSTRWRRITERAREINCSPNTLLTHLRRFWLGGQTRDALLGNYKNCGKPNPRKPGNRGRPSIKHGKANFAVTAKDQEYFRCVIQDFYLTDERKNMTQTLQNLHERFYYYLDGNGDKHIRPPGERPTLRQLSYYAAKNFTLERRLRARKGDKNFEMNHRAVLGTVAQSCLGVGHIYEMDATIVDVTLVSSINRSNIIGRPTLYYIIDRESRLIVGWYLGLENPCWQAALQALFSIAEDKQVLCDRLNIHYRPEDWPAHGVMPQELYVDRGESMSREATKLCTSLETTVTNLPSCRPDWKPIVEGKFALLHQSIGDSTPGYNPASNAKKRRSKDFGLEASLTLSEMEALLVNAIVAHNRTIMKKYPLSKLQLESEVMPSPISLWNHGITSRAGQLRRHSEQSLRIALLPRGNGIVSEKGITLNGCTYEPVTVDRASWFVAGRTRRATVMVSFDRRRCNSVYVHDPREPSGYFMAKLTARSKKYEGMSVAEVADAIALEERLKSGHTDSKAENMLRLHDSITPLISKAINLTKISKQGVSKTARRSNIKETRSIERNIERDDLMERASQTHARNEQLPQSATNPIAPPQKDGQLNSPTSSEHSHSPDIHAPVTQHVATLAKRVQLARQQMMNR